MNSFTDKLPDTKDTKKEDFEIVLILCSIVLYLCSVYCTMSNFRVVVLENFRLELGSLRLEIEQPFITWVILVYM